MMRLKWNEEGKAPTSTTLISIHVANKYLVHTPSVCVQVLGCVLGKGKVFTFMKSHLEAGDSPGQQWNNKKMTGCDEYLGEM